MDRESQEIVKFYAIGSPSQFSERLGTLSRHSLIIMVDGLLKAYINDKNSSTLREFVTTVMSGYTHESRKTGYDGYRDTASGKRRYCEVKPQNYATEDIGAHQRGERKTLPKKLDGSGHFNGYTHKRFKRDMKEKPSLLLSGFVDGRIVYILEVPFNASGIIARLRKRLRDHLPSGDKPGRYLIGAASFGFRDYKDSGELMVNFILPPEGLQQHRPCISQKFYAFLLEYSLMKSGRMLPME